MRFSAFIPRRDIVVRDNRGGRCVAAEANDSGVPSSPLILASERAELVGWKGTSLAPSAERGLLHAEGAGSSESVGVPTRRDTLALFASQTFV